VSKVADPSVPTLQREWAIHLDCGHDVTVPWGAAAPVVMGCLVQHREICDVGTGEPAEPPSWVAPVVVGVLFP
jgi:hypothetical protein